MQLRREYIDWKIFDGIEDKDLRLRFATAADLATVRAIVCHPGTVRATGDTNQSAHADLTKIWAEGPDMPDMRHLIAETLGRPPSPVGYLRLLYPFPERRSLWLSFIAITPSQRRKGYGRRILATLLSAAAKSDRIEVFGMHTGSSNTAATALFESFGFRIAKREPWRNKDGTFEERLTYCQVL
jgi:ribosomal protein S18 acetylase RimI-like enzyme